jgi:adenine phosphoribosyltransferase
MLDLEQFIRDVPDFPKKGIIFKDITPLLAHPQAMREAADRLAEPFGADGVDIVVGIESRGFIFGSLVAERLGAGFVPIRKPGKLPAETISLDYELEYGTAAVEVHTDAVRPGTRVLMVDDLLATGGTMQAACDLVRRLQGRIAGAAFVIELCFLKGRERLKDCRVVSLIAVDG